jgi:hypothetical protein
MCGPVQKITGDQQRAPDFLVSPSVHWGIRMPNQNHPAWRVAGLVMGCVVLGIGMVGFRTWRPDFMIFGGGIIFVCLFRWHR